MEQRKTWFFETQLRRLNYEAFRGTSAESAGPFLDLISESAQTVGVSGSPIGGRLEHRGQVYLDSQQPVWSADERSRHDAFATTLIGLMGNWLDYVDPAKLASALAELKREYERSMFSSVTDIAGTMSAFPRSQPLLGKGTEPPGGDEGVGAAISRAELAAAKPWLIPELYNAKNADTTVAANWLANLEQYVAEFEVELQLAVGGTAGQNLPFDPGSTSGYRALVAFMLQVAPTRSTSNAVGVQILDRAKKKPEDKDLSYIYRPSLRTSGSPLGPVTAFRLSERTKYWTGVFHNPLKECVVLKANSDMGLCQLVRLLYRYGTLPSTLGADSDLTWRTRTAPDETFAQYFAGKAQDPVFSNDAALRERLQTAETKLRTILEESAAHPRSASPSFSVLAEEILKQGLKSYKFWLDEPLRAKDNDTLNKVKAGIELGDADTEMEFWSENHYIMFASSEYLLGQLWETDEFQPGHVFLPADDKIGVTTGAARRDRGRARVLKWLNNRLLFGWMEFHSSGYYREHLWALLNLVDFALDEQVRVKATMAVDLLLFDVVRYLHKGTMGAPGGRSQFKSKNCGWDNDLGDVVEIMLGVRGVFNEGRSQIGSSFATSSYVVPDVLLEMGTSPPTYPFTDRSRVSITFDEAPKYGISWSQKSDAKDSVLQGYAPKRAKYAAFLDQVNREIERTHEDYGATEDDTVFFWGMSAFYNKQVVRNTFAAVDKFDLSKSPAFGGAVSTLIKTILPLVRRAETGFIGSLVGGAVGGVVGFFESDIAADDLEADAADDLSLFIEGSTRTRANILSYRTPDVMLSSIQNFRAGQLNFQSSVNQATLNTSANVFTTSGFAGFDISDVAAAIGGAVVGGAIGMPLIGAAVGVGLNESSVSGTNPLGDDEDGPGWWTGYWALPMVVQQGSAAILAYDFHDAQTFLAEAGSHTWFPSSGFDRVVERRTSAYDDANFPLLDITDTGPKGFWLFGQVIHPAVDGSAVGSGEAYVGVFSNQRPEWLTKDSDPYDSRLHERSDGAIDAITDAIDDKLDDLEDRDEVGYVGRQIIETVVPRSVSGHYRPGINRDSWLAAVVTDLGNSTATILAQHRDDVNALANLYIQRQDLERIWKMPLPDYFADRDWYVDGKNVWILQVGSRAEFGSFENFMDRVSAARIHLDDSGDIECTYDIPRSDGSSDRLHLEYGDGGRFNLNGGGFATDLYPRFENPFVRGGIVEWGQREYCLAWNGKTLLHDFSDDAHPVRLEAPVAEPDATDTVKGLVVFLRTEGEEMDAFTVATATVEIACARLTTDQVVAAGPVGEDTPHDTEWIFLDEPARRSPDMSLTFTHPASTKGDDTPEWSASFTLKALMGDRTLKDCALTMSSLHFEDARRSSGPLPFVVTLSRWADWAQVGDTPVVASWLLAGQPAYDVGWQDHHDLFVLNTQRRLWYRRLSCGATAGAWIQVDAAGTAPDWSQPFSWAGRSDRSGRVDLFVVTEGRLLARSTDVDGRWSPRWTDVAPTTADLFISEPVPLGPGSVIAAVEGGGVLGGGGVDLYLTGTDGDLYTYADWHPGDEGLWQSIDASDFTLAPGVPIQVAGGQLLALADDGSLWCRSLTSTFVLGDGWRRLEGPGFRVTRMAVGGTADRLHLAVGASTGQVSVGERAASGPVTWVAPAPPDGWTPAPTTDLVWARPGPGQWWLFACGIDGSVRSVIRSDNDSSAATWQTVGAAATAVALNPAGLLAATCRAKGMIELFAETSSGGLSWAWWS